MRFMRVQIVMVIVFITMFRCNRLLVSGSALIARVTYKRFISF